MKRYIVLSVVLVLMSVMAIPAYSSTITLSFSYEPTPPGTGTIGVSPASSPPNTPTTLVTFTNIPFNTVVVAGDPIAALNGTYAFTSSGSAYSFNTGTHTLTNTGSFTIGGNTAAGTLITVTNPTVMAYTTNGDIDAEVGFSNSGTSTVTILAALLSDLGISGPFTATLVQDAHCLSTLPGVYPNPSPGMACAAGYGPNPLSRSVDSQYLEVSITTGTVPEPGSALMLGLGLLAIGGGLVRRRRSTK